ncbi:MAG: fibronectin type III domain-containing protein [Emticicia sp.]
MTAFWHVQATNGSESTSPNGNSAITTMFVAPSTPTGLAGAAVGGIGTRINLTWNDIANDETEYEVAYSTLPTGYQTVLTGISITGSGGIGTYQLTGLQPASTYYIWVRAIRNTADTDPTCTPQTNMPTNSVPTGKVASCWSNGLIISTNDNLPAAVTGATIATPYLQRTNTLYFFDNSNNETNFIIERSMGGDFSVIATIPGEPGTGQRKYVDNSTQPNTSYAYRVSSRNATGVGFPESRTSFIRTLPDPPTPPNNLGTFSIGLNSIGLYWVNGPSNATGFLVQQSVDNNSWATISTNPSNNNGFVAQNLNEGQNYFFRVIAFNEGGNGTPSGVLVATTLKRVAPNPASNLAAKTISTTQIDLTWNLGTQDGVTNNRVAQEVYRSSISETNGFLKIAVIGDAESNYSDKTGMPKTKYWYKVLAANLQGQSPFSNVASATTLGPPYAPTNLATVLANDALGNPIIKATWNDSSNDEWGFALERSTDSTFATGVLKADLDSNTIAATSIPIEEGVTYYFRVNASNKYGTSKYSTTTKIDVAVSAAPNAPYDLKGTATAAEISLKWGDDSNKESGFEVERSDDGKTFAKIGATGRNVVAYADKTVKEKTKYYYRVRAINTKGNSGYSNVLESTTLAKVSASIELAAESVFQVYPNPTVDAVKVTLSENMQNESGVITITDRMNREVSRTILTSNQLEYRLDLSNFSEGTYTISLRTATQQIIKRVYKY